MSNAKKCDRCGGFFDPLTEMALMTRIKNPVFVDGEAVRQNRISACLLKASPDEIVDLCPGCTTDFMIFMYGPRGGGKDDGGNHCDVSAADCCEQSGGGDLPKTEGN